jgi:hypothetical protein
LNFKIENQIEFWKWNKKIGKKKTGASAESSIFGPILHPLRPRKQILRANNTWPAHCFIHAAQPISFPSPFLCYGAYRWALPVISFIRVPNRTRAGTLSCSLCRVGHPCQHFPLRCNRPREPELSNQSFILRSFAAREPHHDTISTGGENLRAWPTNNLSTGVAMILGRAKCGAPRPNSMADSALTSIKPGAANPIVTMREQNERWVAERGRVPKRVVSAVGVLIRACRGLDSSARDTDVAGTIRTPAGPAFASSRSRHGVLLLLGLLVLLLRRIDGVVRFRLGTAEVQMWFRIFSMSLQLVRSTNRMRPLLPPRPSAGSPWRCAMTTVGP